MLNQRGLSLLETLATLAVTSVGILALFKLGAATSHFTTLSQMKYNQHLRDLETISSSPCRSRKNSLGETIVKCLGPKSNSINTLLSIK